MAKLQLYRESCCYQSSPKCTGPTSFFRLYFCFVYFCLCHPSEANLQLLCQPCCPTNQDLTSSCRLGDAGLEPGTENWQSGTLQLSHHTPTGPTFYPYKWIKWVWISPERGDDESNLPFNILCILWTVSGVRGDVSETPHSFVVLQTVHFKGEKTPKIFLQS